MNGLISFNNFSLNTAESVSKEILELNDLSREHGLILTVEEAMVLSETRGKALIDNERIEIGVGAIAKIIKRFSTSRYVNEEDYAWILNEITEVFYYIKTETDDKIGDEALVDELFKSFEMNCRGSMDILLGREVERIIRKINSGENYNAWYSSDDGYTGDTKRDTPEEVLRGEFDEGLWSEDDDTYLDDEFYDEEEDIETELDAFDEYLDFLANGETEEESRTTIPEEDDVNE